MSRTSTKLSVYVGIIVSIALGWQLTLMVISSGIQGISQFDEFLSDPGALLYVFLRMTLCLSYWLMKGVNNRTYLICWVFGDLTSSYLYTFGLNEFWHANRNIYVLNFLSFLCVIPLYAFCRYRLFILIQTFQFLARFKFFNAWCETKLQQLSITNAITKFDVWLKCLVIIELVAASLLTFFAFYFQLSPSESISVSLSSNGIPNLFQIKNAMVDIWTFLFICLLLFLLFNDRKKPDGFIPISSAVKKSVIEKFKDN